MESTIGSAGHTEQIVTAVCIDLALCIKPCATNHNVFQDPIPKDNPSIGATKPSKATTEAAAVTHPIQESESRAEGYKGVVKEQLRYVNSTGVHKVRSYPECT